MSRDVERASGQFFGGRSCLDFANTLDWRTSDDPVELIPDYGSLLRWSERRGTLSRRAVQRLARARTPASVRAVMDDAYALRSEIWAIAAAARSGARAPLDAVNRLLASAPPQPPVIRDGSRYVHDLIGRDVREPLWPILWSLSAVLSSDDVDRIGLCSGTGCGWFFVDESPNRTRRWCSSATCGNRERARRAYAKRQRSS
jgi:predicted RNA-binding Zn ribbon-like protein